MSDYAMQAEQEMWDAIASQPAPADEVCDRCGRELAGGLPSPCSKCSPAVACEWFALCMNPAVGTVAHPVLGSVPTCDRCAAKLELEFEEVSTG